MPEDLVVTRTLVVPASELSERFSRSSGPGGQGVNTADSRVELSFDLASSPSVPDRLKDRMLGRLGKRLVDGVLTVVASEHRAQLQNRASARERCAHPARRRAAPPGAPGDQADEGSQERRIAEKKRRAQTKQGRGRGGNWD
ncbi:aminoacyl-tRNA hydrolase [Saccharothrix sp. MB29]|nr:aminoacyl-tRNA hydrolase [Saccharothrix sp. MB29]